MAISRHFDKIFNFLEKIYDGNFMVVNAKIFTKKIFPSGHTARGPQFIKYFQPVDQFWPKEPGKFHLLEEPLGNNHRCQGQDEQCDEDKILGLHFGDHIEVSLQSGSEALLSRNVHCLLQWCRRKID